MGSVTFADLSKQVDAYYAIQYSIGVSLMAYMNQQVAIDPGWLRKVTDLTMNAPPLTVSNLLRYTLQRIEHIRDTGEGVIVRLVLGDGTRRFRLRFIVPSDWSGFDD